MNHPQFPILNSFAGADLQSVPMNAQVANPRERMGIKLTCIIHTHYNELSKVVKNYPVRDLIWVENVISGIKRAVGTQYVRHFMWRTYGTK